MKMDMQKKLSYYTIFTDEISETLKSRIVFSTITGKAVIVDEAIYTSLINNDFGSIANDVLERLIQEQFLVDVNENELEKIIKENKQTANDDKLFYQVIQPSAMCQLGCDYCGQEHRKVNIKNDLIDKLISR